MKISVLVLFTFILLFSCTKPVEMTFNEYLDMKIWEKEELAFLNLEKVSEAESLDDIAVILSDTALLMHEVHSVISVLELKNSEMKELNKLQIEICNIYIKTAKDFNIDNNIDILTNLEEADKKFLEFIKLGKSSFLENPENEEVSF